MYCFVDFECQIYIRMALAEIQRFRIAGSYETTLHTYIYSF